MQLETMIKYALLLSAACFCAYAALLDPSLPTDAPGQCFIPVECTNGTVFGQITVESANECLGQCRNYNHTNGCQYWTYRNVSDNSYIQYIRIICIFTCGEAVGHNTPSFCQ